MFFNNGYPTVMTIMAKAVNGNPNVYFVRTVLKARSVTPLPQMLPKEIRADLLLEERVMRGNEVFVKNETVSKINLNTFLPLKMASQMPVALRIVVHC